MAHGFPQVPFKVVGIEDFNVVPIKKGQKYVITEVDDEGKYKTRTNGVEGWLHAHLVSPIPSQQQQNNQRAQPRTPNSNTAQPRAAAPSTSQQKSPPAKNNAMTDTFDPFANIKIKEWGDK